MPSAPSSLQLLLELPTGARRKPTRPVDLRGFRNARSVRRLRDWPSCAVSEDPKRRGASWQKSVSCAAGGHRQHVTTRPESRLVSKSSALGDVLAPPSGIEAVRIEDLGFPAALYEQLPESIAVYTREGRCVYFNPATEQMFGKTLSELRGQTLWEVFPDSVGNPFHRAFQRVASAGLPERFEHFYHPWQKWFENNVYLSGELVWVIATDITAQKQATELERAGAARLRALSEASQALAEAHLDLQQVLDTVASEVAKHVGDACAVTLMDEERLKLAAFHHPNPEAKEFVLKMIANCPQEVGQSIAGRVVASGMPLVLAEVAPGEIAAALKPEYRSFAERFPIYSLVAVPLLARGRVIGTIQASRYTPQRSYTHADQSLLEELATRSALAIDNARLHRQATMQAQVLESMSEGVSVADENGYILYTNPAEDRMFGYPRGGLEGQHVTVQNTYAPEENQRIVDEVIRQLKAKGIWSGEWSNIRKDKTPFVTRAHITALELDGKYHWVCVQQDITEHKRIERERDALLGEARRAREQLQLIIDAVPVLISYVDAECRYRLNNLTYEKWFGRSREELHGKHLREVLGDDAFEAVRPDVEQALSGKLVTYERRLPYADAGPRWVHGTCIPDIDANGAVRGYVALIQDIGERKLHEEQLHRRSEFEQQLLGIVSHDLRNPISVMMMSASSLLRGEEVDPKTTKALLRIVANGERAIRLIRDLLDFTQARLGGGIPIKRSDFNFHAHVRQAAQEVQAAHPHREVLIFSEGSGHGSWDPDRVIQIVDNLVSNALCYSPETTPVRVQTRGDAHSVSLDVHNLGTPIPAAMMEGLFEPFKRGKETSANTTRSIGLGLYIVKQLVIAHGGAIEFSSSDTFGTTFTVRLPRDQPLPLAGAR